MMSILVRVEMMANPIQEDGFIDDGKPAPLILECHGDDRAENRLVLVWDSHKIDVDAMELAKALAIVGFIP